MTFLFVIVQVGIDVTGCEYADQIHCSKIREKTYKVNKVALSL